MTYTLNGREVADIEIDDVDPSDYPDFSDARISYAVYADNGAVLSDEDLEKFAEKYFELVGEMALEHHI